MRRLRRLLWRVTHSYVLLALGSVFVVGICANLWLRYEASRDGRLIFTGGMLACVWVAVAVQLVMTTPRDRL
jgi:hypothetical protein